MKAGREKQLSIYNRTIIRLTADISSETMKARRQWDSTFKVLKGNKTKQNKTINL